MTRQGFANADGTPKDVDREFVAAFFIFNELGGREPGLVHSINGFIFGNLTGLVMKAGEKVRWYIIGMGNEVDLHSPHWHGKTVRVDGHQTDVLELLPATMITADMNADNGRLSARRDGHDERPDLRDRLLRAGQLRPPGQRYASKGCYVAQLGPGPRPELLMKSEWVLH
jgi:hypothetical protein